MNASYLTDAAVRTLYSAGAVTLWVLFGCLLLVGGLKLVDRLTPGKLEQQVFVEKNLAAAVVYGGAFVAIAIIIASAMH